MVDENLTYFPCTLQLQSNKKGRRRLVELVGATKITVFSGYDLFKFWILYAKLVNKCKSWLFCYSYL